MTMFDHLREQAYGSFDADPQSLLVGFGNPGPGNATLIHMRFQGFDQQVTHEMLSPTYHSHWLQPLRRRVDHVMYEGLPSPDGLSVVTWQPLAWFADATLDAMHAAESGLPDTAIDRTTMQVRIRFLIYRREPEIASR